MDTPLVNPSITNAASRHWALVIVTVIFSLLDGSEENAGLQDVLRVSLVAL